MGFFKKRKKEKTSDDKGRPHLFWLITEAGRAFAELGLSLSYDFIYKYNSESDGHPVLVLPGFMASDTSTVRLRNFIDEIGYKSYGWEQGRNYGKPEILEDIIPMVESLYEQHGQKVTIIGWSLGGVYARQVSKALPNMTRQVITLGSPFRGISKPNNVAWVYNLINGGKKVTDVDPLLLIDLPKPTTVPTTSIYSKQDGVVPWELCMEVEETRIHQNIEVHGSHLGMGHNPSVLKIIADRLQYSQEDWVHFEPEGFFDDLVLYPSM